MHHLSHTPKRATTINCILRLGRDSNHRQRHHGRQLSRTRSRATEGQGTKSTRAANHSHRQSFRHEAASAIHKNSHFTENRFERDYSPAIDVGVQNRTQKVSTTDNVKLHDKFCKNSLLLVKKYSGKYFSPDLVDLE